MSHLIRPVFTYLNLPLSPCRVLLLCSASQMHSNPGHWGEETQKSQTQALSAGAEVPVLPYGWYISTCRTASVLRDSWKSLHLFSLSGNQAFSERREEKGIKLPTVQTKRCPSVASEHAVQIYGQRHRSDACVRQIVNTAEYLNGVIWPAELARCLHLGWRFPIWGCRSPWGPDDLVKKIKNGR